MKQKWIRPQTTIEKFVPNEYIAVCWGVACDTEASNRYEKSIGNYDSHGLFHNPSECGQSTHQLIYDNDENGYADEMWEVKADMGRNLRCTIWEPGFTRPGNINSITASSGTIYWTTTAGGRTWHHIGTVTGTVPGHPNAS